MPDDVYQLLIAHVQLRLFSHLVLSKSFSKKRKVFSRQDLWSSICSIFCLDIQWCEYIFTEQIYIYIYKNSFHNEWPRCCWQWGGINWNKWRAAGAVFLATIPQCNANRGVINHTCSFQEDICREKKSRRLKSISACVAGADLSCITHKAMPGKPSGAIYFPADMPDISSSKRTQGWILVMECTGIMPASFFSFFFFCTYRMECLIITTAHSQHPHTLLIWYLCFLHYKLHFS